MIYDALLVPHENPPALREIKRALLNRTPFRGRHEAR